MKFKLNSMAKKYCDDGYIQEVVNNQYEKLNNYITDEWRNNTEQLFSRQSIQQLDAVSGINPYSVIGADGGNNENEVVEGVKQGGMTAGAIGLGLAGYAAWLGPAAAYVSIGTAVSAFVPPLLIAGALGGAVLKWVGSSKTKINQR